MAKKKNDKGFKPCKGYNSRLVPKESSGIYFPKGLKYGILDTMVLRMMYIETSPVFIPGSWLGLVIMILGLLCKREDPKTLMINLAEKGVLSGDFGVVDRYGKVSDSKKKFEVYRIPDSTLYLELVVNTETIYKAIFDLFNYLGYDSATIQFKAEKVSGCLNTLTGDTKSDVEVEYNEESGIELWRSVNNLISLGSDKIIFVSEIKIFDEKASIDSIEKGMELLVKSMFTAMGLDVLRYIQSDTFIGVTDLERLASTAYTKRVVYETGNRKLALYYGNDIDKQLEFMKHIIENAGFSESDILIKVEMISE